MLAIYFSPMLLGLMLLLAIAVAATALWYVSRPYAGPAFWMASGWTLILGVMLFIGFMVTGSPVLNVLGNAGQLAGEALFLLGIFRFLGRPLPLWIVPASVGLMMAFNIRYWVVDGNSDFLLGVYSTIAGLLPLQAPRGRPSFWLASACCCIRGSPCCAATMAITTGFWIAPIFRRTSPLATCCPTILRFRPWSWGLLASP